MSPATQPAPTSAGTFAQTSLRTLSIDGALHSLVWVRNSQRSVSLLVARPEEGVGRPLLLGSFDAEESLEEVEALLADYEEHYVSRPSAERPEPRALRPDDLRPDASAR